MFSRGEQHMESMATEGYEPRGMPGPAGDAKLGRLMRASGRYGEHGGAESCMPRRLAKASRGEHTERA